MSVTMVEKFWCIVLKGGAEVLRLCLHTLWYTSEPLNITTFYLYQFFQLYHYHLPCDKFWFDLLMLLQLFFLSFFLLASYWSFSMKYDKPGLPVSGTVTLPLTNHLCFLYFLMRKFIFWFSKFSKITKLVLELLIMWNNLFDMWTLVCHLDTNQVQTEVKSKCLFKLTQYCCKFWHAHYNFNFVYCHSIN